MEVAILDCRYYFTAGGCKHSPLKDNKAVLALPAGSDREICLQCERRRFNPWVRDDPLEKGMITHSSVLAWRIP